MTKFILEEFAKELKKKRKLLVYLGSGSHGDHLTRLFGRHRGFYNGQ